VTDTVILLPKTKRFKQLIKRFGSVWTVVGKGPVQCFDNREGLLIEEPNQTYNRWVELNDVEWTTPLT